NTSNNEIHWNTEKDEIIRSHTVKGVIIRDRINNEVRRLEVQGFFVAIGHQPNTEIFKGWLDMDEQGYLKTQPGSTRTKIEGVFACGDAQDKVYRQAVTAAGTGCMAAL